MHIRTKYSRPMTFGNFVPAYQEAKPSVRSADEEGREDRIAAHRLRIQREAHGTAR